MRAAVLNSGSFLEPRLRELLMAATATAAPAAAAAPAPGPRAALAALLRLLLPARPGPATANAPVTAGPAIAPASSVAVAAIAVPLYDAQGALRAGASAVPGAAAPAPGPATASAFAATPSAAATQPAPPGTSPGGAAIPAAVSTGIAADLKGQLFVLLEAASGWLRARPDASRTPPPGGNLAAPGLPLYTARGLVSGDPAPAQTGAATLPAADPMVARLAQQLAATEPARPRDPADLVETLLRYVVGALARTRVHQLGVHPEIRRQGDSSPLQAWSVEIPIAHGGRMDALELRVEDHGRREDPRGGAERVWQVLMSLELERIGPLHALLRLSGTRLATTLWVENPAALASARDTLAELGDCLRAEGVDVTRLECLPGAPPPRARSHDNLLDVST